MMRFRRKVSEELNPLDRLIRILGLCLTAEILLADTDTLRMWRLGNLEPTTAQLQRIIWFLDVCRWFKANCSKTVSVKSWILANVADFSVPNDQLETNFERVSERALREY